MMIIFDLDGTLADYEHRKHFIDPKKNKMYECHGYCPFKNPEGDGWYHKETSKKFKPDWESFYEACDKDKPIESVIHVLSDFLICDLDVVIFSGRCESVRGKTQNWLAKHVYQYLLDPITPECRIPITMRPTGNTDPDEVIKERWLDEAMAEGKKIYYVFDADPKSIRMWLRYGLFVFNCCQNEQEF